MKQPKKLTRDQKKLLVDLGLFPKEWMNLFEDDLYLHIVKKDSSDRKIIDEFEVSLSFDARSLRNTFVWNFLFGSNNWRKYHGLPMRRRKWLRQ